MNINDITAYSEGRAIHPDLVSVTATADNRPAVFKVIYLTSMEIEEIRRGLDSQQWYAAMSEALRFTAKFPPHLLRMVPLGQLHAMIAHVLIVER